MARADDLNCLMVSSLDRNVRCANEGAMIDFYLQSLCAALPTEKREMAPSLEELSAYYKMATQGRVYRCLLLNLLLSGLSAEHKKHHLEVLVARTLDACVDHGLHKVLAIGK